MGRRSTNYRILVLSGLLLYLWQYQKMHNALWEQRRQAERDKERDLSFLVQWYSTMPQCQVLWIEELMLDNIA